VGHAVINEHGWYGCEGRYGRQQHVCIYVCCMCGMRTKLFDLKLYDLQAIQVVADLVIWRLDDLAGW
jgi:hypothetical protein